jgi:drug/metabolite transporter (DMT)-like permease
MKGDKALAWIAFAIVCVVWGTTYLGIRIAIETIPPLLLTGVRFTTGGLVMLAIARWRGETIPRDVRTLGNLAIVGLLMVGVGNLAVVWAEQWVPSGMAALLVATSPFWAAMLELFRREGERLDVRAGLGMAAGFVGVALLVTPGSAGASFGSHFILGALAIQLGAASWQFGSMRSKYHLKEVPLLASAALQMLFGGVVVLVMGMLIGELPRFHVNPRTFGALLYLTIAGSVIAYSAYVYALAHLPTTRTALYAYINPVVAVILGWLILNESLTWLSVIAMAVILAGVALVQTAKGRATPSAPSIEEERAA